MRIVILQDSVLLLSNEKFKNHPLFSHPIFSSELFLNFSTQYFNFIKDYFPQLIQHRNQMFCF